MFHFRISICVFTLVVVGGCQSQSGDIRPWQASDHQQPPGTEDDPRDPNTIQQTNLGQTLWTLHCQTCHGPLGRGDGPGANSAMKLPDMSSQTWQASLSNTQIATIVRRGRGAMPAFGEKLTPEALTKVIEYVRNLGGNE